MPHLPLLVPYRPSSVLRSSFSVNLLQVSRTNLTFGSRSFRVAAATIWNSLPESIRSSDKIQFIHAAPKNAFFQAVFNSPLAANSSASDSVDSCD